MTATNFVEKKRVRISLQGRHESSQSFHSNDSILSSTFLATMGGQIQFFFIASLVIFVSLKGVYTCECKDICKAVSQIQKKLGSVEGKLDALVVETQSEPAELLIKDPFTRAKNGTAQNNFYV